MMFIINRLKKLDNYEYCAQDWKHYIFTRIALLVLVLIEALIAFFLVGFVYAFIVSLGVFNLPIEAV